MVTLRTLRLSTAVDREFALGDLEMSLTVFLAICILGCDLLIYFLYEWALGESKRIRKRAAGPRLLGSNQEWSRHTQTRPARAAQVIEMNRSHEADNDHVGTSVAYRERLAYRRLAESMGQGRRRA